MPREETAVASPTTGGQGIPLNNQEGLRQPGTNRPDSRGAAELLGMKCEGSASTGLRNQAPGTGCVGPGGRKGWAASPGAKQSPDG